jgi:hypothetical protein
MELSSLANLTTMPRTISCILVYAKTDVSLRRLTTALAIHLCIISTHFRTTKNMKDKYVGIMRIHIYNSAIQEGGNRYYFYCTDDPCTSLVLDIQPREKSGGLQIDDWSKTTVYIN